MAIGIDTGFLVASELADHPLHAAARNFLSEHIAGKQTFVLCPQVLSEFIHVVTDPRRFDQPVAVGTAVQRAETIWNSRETRQVFASDDSTVLFFHWMRLHRLGRKRVLDTQLAALYYSANVKEIVTTDFRDFNVFDVFTVHLI